MPAVWAPSTTVSTGGLRSHEVLSVRAEDFLTTISCTERFVEAVRRLGYEQDIAFRELPVRGVSTA